MSRRASEQSSADVSTAAAKRRDRSDRVGRVLSVLTILAIICALSIPRFSGRLGRPYRVDIPLENFLTESYSAGATLRQIDSPSLIGFDASSGVYVMDHEKSYAGYELSSGKQLWELQDISCSQAIAGKMYCSQWRNDYFQLLDLGSGTLTESYSKPDLSIYAVKLIGVRNGIEYFFLPGTEQNAMVAAGKDDSWLWITPLTSSSFLEGCAVLADEIGCESSNLLEFFDLKTGEPQHQVTGKFFATKWLLDGYTTLGNNLRMSTYDLNGRRINGFIFFQAPEGLFSLVDMGRRDAEVVDAAGEIVVKSTWRGDQIRSGKRLNEHYSWQATSPKGDLFAVSKGTLSLRNKRAEIIEEFPDFVTADVKHRLLIVYKEGNHFLLVPKQ